MMSVRHKAEITLSIIVVVYVLNLIRQMLVGSWFVGEILAYTAWGIAVALAGIVVLWIFMILHKIGNSSGELSSSAKRILYWLAVLIGGTIVYRNAPAMLGWFSNFISENMTNIANQPAIFVTRLTPFAIIGVYAGVVYAALFIMILVGLACVVFDGEAVRSSVLSYIKVPLTISIMAIILSLINHELAGIHILWAVFFIIVIIGQHKAFAKAMMYVKFAEPTNKNGFKLYLSVRNISNTTFDNTIDKVAVFVVAGLALLMQGILVVTFIIYVISNFSVMQDVVAQWFS